jgi:hypothetical protein
LLSGAQDCPTGKCVRALNAVWSWNLSPLTTFVSCAAFAAFKNWA